MEKVHHRGGLVMIIPINEYMKVIPNITKDFSAAYEMLRDQWNGATETKCILEKGEMRTTKFHPPKGYVFSQIIENGVNLEILKYHEENDRAVLMVHGGSFLYRMSDSFIKMVPYYAEAGGHATVVTVDYQVVPHVSYDEMIADVVRGYEWMLAKGYKPENIIIAGDSSGGGTTLATILYLREHDYPMPAGVITLSACTNLGRTTISVGEKYDVDLFFGGSELLKKTLDIVLGDEDYRNPYYSPYFANYHDFPPMLIQVGMDEMLLDDSKDIAKKAYKAGVDVTLEIYEKMFHDFQNCKGILKEADLAWVSIEMFMKRIYNGHSNWKSGNKKKNITRVEKVTGEKALQF